MIAIGAIFVVGGLLCLIISFLSIVQYNPQSALQSPLFPTADSDNLKSLPKARNSMSDLFSILRALESNIPFGFAHFNDGEIIALDCTEGEKTVFSWNQKCTPRLNVAMQNALRNTAPNFYVGLPCNCEFKGVMYLRALGHLNITHDLPYQYYGNLKANNPQMPSTNEIACPATSATLKFKNEKLKDRLTVATLFINGNFIRAKKELTRILNKAVDVQKRGVHVVVATERFVDRLPFPVTSAQYVTTENAFENNYDTFRTAEFLAQAKYGPNDIVLIMAGSVGRILASEWGLLRSDVTFLEMGSFWDTELWSRTKHFLGVQRPCMDQQDLIGLPCNNRWIHSLPQIIPEGYLPLGYLC